MLDDAVLGKLVLLVLIFYGQTRTTTAQHFETLASRKVKGNFTYSTGENMGLLQCTALCASDGRCKSASYKSNEGSCQLTSYTVNGPNDREGLVEDNSWRTISRFPILDIEGVGYWFGLKDLHDDNSFAWKSDGASPLYTAWGSRQPDNSPGEDCVIMNSYYSFDWYDNICSNRRRTLCEM